MPKIRANMFCEGFLSFSRSYQSQKINSHFHEE
jgi:hypothetical protein